MEKGKKDRLLYILLASLAMMVLGIVSFSAYLGAFRSINVEEKTMGPYYLVYKEMEGGNFSQVDRITTELASLLQNKGITNAKPFDVFYPEFQDQRKDEIGFIVSESDFSAVADLDHEVKTRMIHAQRCMMSEFPWKNPLSFFVGYLRIDPAFEKHREQKGYKKVEAFTLNDGDTIIYIQPIMR